MRAVSAIILLTVAILAGCTSAPTTTPSPSPPPRAEPTPTPTPVELPELEHVLALLDTAPDDTRTPPARLGVVLEPDQPQILSDERDQRTGAGLVRVSCSSVDGAPVTIGVEIGGVDQGGFEAQCGAAPAATFVTQESRYDFSAEYAFTVSSTVAAVVAVGVVPD